MWETITLLTDANGGVTTRTNSFTELATGLNYLENDEWKDSVAEFELIPDVAIVKVKGS